MCHSFFLLNVAQLHISISSHSRLIYHMSPIILASIPPLMWSQSYPVCFSHNVDVSCYSCLMYELPHDKTNKVTMCPAKTQISLGIPSVWSESSLCTQCIAKDPSFLHTGGGGGGQRRLWSDWAHMPFCWFCHEAAHMSLRLRNMSLLIEITGKCIEYRGKFLRFQNFTWNKRSSLKSERDHIYVNT